MRINYFWFITTLLVVLGLSIILIGYLGFSNIRLFYSGLLLGGSYLGFYFLVKYQRNNLEKETEFKKTLPYCWNKANEILRLMPDGQPLSWDKGNNRRTDTKLFYENGRPRWFRSFLGFTSNTHSQVVVIFDIDREDIFRFYSNPPPEILRNPFFDVELWFNPQREGRDRYDDYRQRRRFDRYDDYGGYRRDEQYVDRGRVEVDVEDFADSISGDR